MDLSRLRRLLGPAIICLAAFIATSPDLMHKTSCGHDFDFHLASWLDAQASWKHGLPYPHWAPSPNYGAGEPRFVFYPPLTWMLGAAFGLIFPWKGVELAITCSFLAATGLATRMLARQAMADAPATLAGCIALFSGYSMFTAFERTAFGELAGGFWIPLLLLLIFRDGNAQGSPWRRALDGSAVSLALVISGAWLSNAPLGVMASYLLAGVALSVALLRRSWAPILRSLVAVTLGLGLTAIYLVPAAVEQKWVQISQATNDPGVAIENSFLFGRHADPNLELHDVELMRVSIIALVMIAFTLVSFFIAWRRGRLPRQRSWWIPLALIPVVVLLLQLPISLPLWNLLPKLRFLQFPWRWLVVTEAPLGIFIAVAIWPTRRWLRVVAIAASTAGFLFITGVTLFLFHQHCDPEDSVRGMLAAFSSGQGFEGADEYAPPGADNSQVAFGLPDACLTTNPSVVLASSDDGNTPQWDPANPHCDAIYTWLRRAGRNSAEHLLLSANIPHAGFLILHLRTYPAWKVNVNGQTVALDAHPIYGSLPRRDDGLMAVPVPRGPVQVDVDWTITGDVVMGRLVSLMSLGYLVIIFLIERKLNAGKSKPNLG
ncbi:6-pyruvoyl-tetrahydropterin synthase-related protein [Telmatobacter sp. DSM 110680]|uniref:6-pyruvoyl-tetrahydropterin synthase-related protein n=1 Tax=Telmatobacter sp. DSM 110680 TaxID=3036704 RepID=A0AAU7DJH6_9BACT